MWAPTSGAAGVWGLPARAAKRARRPCHDEQRRGTPSAGREVAHVYTDDEPRVPGLEPSLWRRRACTLLLCGGCVSCVQRRSIGASELKRARSVSIGAGDREVGATARPRRSARRTDAWPARPTPSALETRGVCRPLASMSGYLRAWERNAARGHVDGVAVCAVQRELGTARWLQCSASWAIDGSGAAARVHTHAGVGVSGG